MVSCALDYLSCTVHAATAAVYIYRLNRPYYAVSFTTIFSIVKSAHKSIPDKLTRAEKIHAHRTHIESTENDSAGVSITMLQI